VPTLLCSLIQIQEHQEIVKEMSLYWYSLVQAVKTNLSSNLWV